MNIISNEDLEIIRKFEEISRRGFYADSRQVTDLYNKIMGTHVAYTSCGQCIKMRINGLVAAADQYEANLKASDEVSADEVDNTKKDENKDVIEAENKVKGRRGRKSKKG